jgi:FkbM family methyltransferase
MKILNKMLSYFGIRLTKSSTYSYLIEELNSFSIAKNESKFINSVLNSSYASDAIVEALRIRSKSKAQLNQDLIVLLETDFKKAGYFVEFGATNGISLSNSFLLEKEFGWQGILAEPGKTWINDLRLNRNCNISDKCVWSTSGEILQFNETELRELSTIDIFSLSDSLGTARTNGVKYLVETISLLDLLQEHNAPSYIDLLSIDTEGSEFEILSSFNFEKYEFGLIMCEHNFTPQREEIYELLTSKGYQRIFQEISYQDDWYSKRKVGMII